MLDGRVRSLFEPAINGMARQLARVGIGADRITITAFLTGVAAALAIVAGAYGVGFALILASRFLDGLDGAVSRCTGSTDRGGYLDIVLDFTFYGLIPLAFVVRDPGANGLAGAILITSFYVNGSTFLAYSIFAQKRGMETSARGSKAIYFTTGLAEATETIIVFGLWCVFPHLFVPIAYVFSALCFYTGGARVLLAWRTLD